VIQRSAKEVGKDRYNVDLHRGTKSKTLTTKGTKVHKVDQELSA